MLALGVIALGDWAGCARVSGPTVGRAPTASAQSSRMTASASVRARLPRPAHVVVVIFENKDESQVIGAAGAGYFTSLARSGAVLTDSHGIAHPRQPNYNALLAGSTDQVTGDSCPLDLGAAPNLARQLLDAGDTFVGYAESMPPTGFTGCSGGRWPLCSKTQSVGRLRRCPAQHQPAVFSISP